MSDFTDAVLALNPVFFGVLYDPPGSTVMTDLSGNDNHGTYEPAAVFGLPSAIETDPASFSVGGAFGFVPAPALSQMDLRNNYTVIGFTYYDSIASAGTIHLWGRKGQFGLSHNVLAGINGNVITSDITLSTGQYSRLTDPVFPVSGTFYMITQVRNSTVHNLYTNDRLAAFDDTLTTDPIALNDPSEPWWLGQTENTAAFPGLRTTAIIILDYALSAAQVAAVYEASQLAIFISGRSDANPTAILRSDFEPDPVSFPWRHNWTEPLIERITFRSAISQAVTGVEEVAGERLAPRREMEFTQVLKSNVERRKLRALLWANQHAKWFVPVRQYAEQLAAPLSAGATLTPITTAYKDYEDGGWIGFREVDATGAITHWEERLITAVNPNSVEHEALVNSYAAYRSTVYPVRRALLPASVSLKGHTDSVEELTITARFLPEDEAVVPNRLTIWTPTIKYRDYEVFDGLVWQSNDWSEEREYEVERAGESLDFDTGLIGFESDTAGASETFSYRMVLDGHANIAAFLGWFYARRGALAQLWVPTMQVDFEILASDSPANQITVRDTNYSDAFALAEARRDIAFVYIDGTMEFRRVTAFEGTVNETLTLGAALPTFTNLRFISLLKFCRLDADQLELAWETDDKVVVAWRFHEMLHTPEGTGLSSLSPSASLSPSLSPSASPSPSSSVSPSRSPSASVSPSASISPSASQSPSASGSASVSPSASASPSASPSQTPSPSPSPSA